MYSYFVCKKYSWWIGGGGSIMLPRGGKSHEYGPGEIGGQMDDFENARAASKRYVKSLKIAFALPNAVDDYHWVPQSLFRYCLRVVCKNSSDVVSIVFFFRGIIILYRILKLYVSPFIVWLTNYTITHQICNNNMNHEHNASCCFGDDKFKILTVTHN